MRNWNVYGRGCSWVTYGNSVMPMSDILRILTEFSALFNFGYQEQCQSK